MKGCYKLLLVSCIALLSLTACNQLSERTKITLTVTPGTPITIDVEAPEGTTIDITGADVLEYTIETKGINTFVITPTADQVTIQALQFLGFGLSKGPGVTKVNIPLLPKLHLLELRDLSLQELTIEECPSLEHFYLIKTGLSSFDFTPFRNLQKINCTEKNFVSIDVTGLRKLDLLELTCPKLRSITFGDNEMLTEIYSFMGAFSVDELNAIYQSLPTMAAGQKGSWVIVNEETSPKEYQEVVDQSSGEIAIDKGWDLISNSYEGELQLMTKEYFSGE